MPPLPPNNRFERTGFAGRSTGTLGNDDSLLKAHTLLGWRRRYWIGLAVLGLLGYVIFALLTAEDDHKERVRVSVAIVQAGAIRDAALERFEKTKQLPADLSTFIAQPHYVSRGDTNAADMPARVAFSFKAEGPRLLVIFDPDQGALAGQTLTLELQVQSETIQWKCWSTQIQDRHLPPQCRSGSRG